MKSCSLRFPDRRQAVRVRSMIAIVGTDLYHCIGGGVLALAAN